MKFLPVCELRVQHAYYTSGRCTDFQILPAPTGERFLRNHRLLVKTRSDGITVLASVSPGDPASTTNRVQPFIPFHPDLTLAFYLHLSDPGFRLFTDLTTYDAVANPVYRYHRAESAGDTDTAGGELILQDGDSTLPQQVFAAVEIAPILPDWLASGPAVFTITFVPRRTRWAYYFVTDKKDPPRAPRIEDKAPPAGDSPLQFHSEALHTREAPDDGVARELADRYPDHHRFRLLSDHEIPCRQAARKRLELYFGDEQLATSLANPPLRNFSTLAVEVDATVQKQDSLFQIIEY